MRINYQSDFKIIEKNLNGDVNTPFRFTYRTVLSGCVVAEFDGHGYKNCHRLDDGSLLVILTGMDSVPALCRSNANTIFLMLILPMVSAILYRWRLQVLSSFPARRMRAQRRSFPIRIMPHTMRCRAYLCQIRSMMMC